MGPDPAPSMAGSSVEVRGRVFDQVTGVPLEGIRVSAGGTSTRTDADGRFLLQAAGTHVTLSGSGYYDRVASLAGSAGRFALVPRTFDMAAFNDVARDHSTGTLRWLASPAIYVDVRPHAFAGGVVSAEWVEQVAALAPRFVSQWTGGALSASSVTVGTNPPAPGTPGTLVILFDEDPARYPSASSAGTATPAHGGDGVIESATVRLRFSGLTGGAAAISRQAVLGHELGHAVGLAHMDGATASMMTGIVRTPELTAFDRAAGALLYSRLPGTRADDREI
ncbi:MAG TPA: hypothetical protein VFH11_11590 [Gemmatimonadota bacterium]|nr:hypothetical protein [Gemmatimonadota bacterium]